MILPKSMLVDFNQLIGVIKGEKPIQNTFFIVLAE